MNKELIEREFALYRKDEHEARSILENAADGVTSPEDDARFEALIASAEVHKARADKLVQMDENAAALDATVRSLIGDAGESGGETRGDFNTSLLANIRAIQDGHRKNGQFEGELFTQGMVDLEKRAIADFSDNGALYTTDFATQVAVYQRTASPWINLASVINADNGRPLNLPRVTADPTSYTPGEGTAITESTPTVGSAALTTTAYKTLSYVSMEAEADELIGLLSIIAKTQGRELGFKFGTALTAAVVAAATNGGTATAIGGLGTATGTFIGYEDLIDLEMGIAVPYRATASYVAANSAIKKMKKWRDANGVYLWVPALAAGAPSSINGYPIYEDPGLAVVASATKSVLFGDVSAVVVKQMALRVATSEDFKFDTDQVALKTVYRAGGALPDAAAIRYLVSANT